VRRGLDVTAIVVTHDSADVLDACLGSLRAAEEGIGLTIVVSDSGSREPPEETCTHYGAALIAGPNEGFGAAVNRSLGHEAVARASWLLVCNPDTEIAGGSLAAFITRAAELPRCAVAGPRLVDEEGALICSIGREPTPADYWRSARTTWADWQWDESVYAGESPADWLAGCFLLLRADAFRAVGGFDERFFLYSEEVDLCTRLRRLGWQVAYLPSLTVLHRLTRRSTDPHLSRMLVWSKLRYARKWHHRAGALSMRLALVVLHWRQVRQRRRAGRSDAFERAQLWAALRGPGRAYGPPQR
jgi:GT2 family glycosyltransferase